MNGKKIVALPELLEIRKRLREENKRVVFTNGCFDLLHAGHIHLFKKAKSQGDVLVVALNEDQSIKKLKGASRPVFPLAERLEILEALEPIDYLTWFSEETPLNIIRALLPDVLVKGGDWKPGRVVGRREVEKAGGKVVIVPYLKGRSTSSLLDKIKKDFSK